jgi:4-amino-4-deoxy-L-arabinose transferase-like glycosyltransferase
LKYALEIDATCRNMITQRTTDSAYQLLSNALLVLSAGILVSWVCFYNLGRPFSRADEVMYVRGTQGMLAHNSLLVPYLDDLPTFNKPPLLHWLSLLSVRVLGESVVTHRLPSAIAGMMVFGVTGLMTFHLSRSRVAAWLAVLAMAGCSIVSGTNGVRTVGLESTLSLLTILILWLLYSISNALLEGSVSRAIVRRRSIMAGFLFALGVLTKSIAIGITLPIIGVYILIRRYQLGISWRALTRACVWPSLLFCVCAVSLPGLYYGYLALSHPDAFGVILQQEILNRVSRGYHHRKDVAFYLRLLFVSRRVYAPELLIVALVYSSWLVWARGTRHILFLMLWAIIPVILFSIVPSRLPWYIFPAVPPLAMLIGISLRDIGVTLASTSLIQSGVRRALLVTAWAICAAIALYSMFPPVVARVTSGGTVLIENTIGPLRDLWGARLQTLLVRSVELDRQEVAYVQFLRPERIDTVQGVVERVAGSQPPVLLIASHGIVANLPSTAGWSGYSIVGPWKEREKQLVLLIRIGEGEQLPKDFRAFSQAVSGLEFVTWLKARSTP